MAVFSMIPATSDESISRLCQLADRLWTEHYTPLIGAQQVRYMVDKFQSPGAVKQQIHDGYRYYFLCWDQQIAGYTAVHPEKDSMFLSKIYVDRAFRNKGIARATVEHIKAQCRENHLGKIYLTVNRGNLGSIAAYQKLGFRIAFDQKADIGNGFFMDDHIMELYL